MTFITLGLMPLILWRDHRAFNWCVLIKTWLLLELKREIWIFQFHYTLVKPLFLFLMINLFPMEENQFDRNFDDLRQTSIHTAGRHTQQLSVNTHLYTHSEKQSTQHNMIVRLSNWLQSRWKQRWTSGLTLLCEQQRPACSWRGAEGRLVVGSTSRFEIHRGAFCDCLSGSPPSA